MNRNALYVIIGILVVLLVFLGWKYYEDQNTARLEIKIGDGGVSVETK